MYIWLISCRQEIWHQGNAGYALYLDILMPIVLIVLFIAYRMTVDKQLANKPIE